MHRRHAVVELRQAAEQLVDVHVLGAVHGGEGKENEFEVGRGAARRVRVVVDQNPVGEKAAQRRLELVVVRVDETGHHDAAAGVDHIGTTRVQVRSDGKDLLALDQHVGLGEVAHLRVHRHHGTATDDIASAPPAGVLRLVFIARRGRARREQIDTCGGDPGRRRRLQKIAPRTGMVLRNSVIAQLAHGLSPPR